MARLCRAVPASLAMSTRTMTPCCHLKLRWECLGSCPSGPTKAGTVHARSETASVKRSFREAWKKAQHCIIPAVAIYEPDWRTGKAIPTRISRADGRLLGIAGLWEVERQPFWV